MKAMPSLPPAQQAASAAASPVSRANAKAQEKAAVTFTSRLDAGASSHLPPAQAARTALEARPDLAVRPFGAIVSLLARHQELPAADETAPAHAPAPDLALDPTAPEAATGDVPDLA